MKNTSIRSFGTILSILMLQSVFGQTDTFDIVRYTAPKNWTRQATNGVVTYAHLNKNSGAFCVLAIYASSPSTGDPKKDFKKDWKDHVIELYPASPDPQTEEQSTADGWKAITGLAPIKLDSVNAIVVSTTFSGFGKTTCILATLNDQSYLTGIDSFLQSVQLDSNSTPAKNDEINAGTSNLVYSKEALVGTWSSYSAAIGNYVTSSGVFVGSADVHTAEEYEFKANNQYIQKFIGSVYGRMYYTETKGTYKISGGNLTLSPLSRRGGYSGAIKDERNLMGKPETLQFYIGPNKWEVGPFLNLHRDGKYYMWEDYPYNYYQKITAAVAPQK